MLIFAKYPPFVIDDNGEHLVAEQCTGCKDIFYVGAEDCDGGAHPIFCHNCNHEHQAQDGDALQHAGEALC